MSRRPILRRLVSLALCAAIAANSSSCGTMLHPERCGQPPGRIDPAVAILDGVGLLLFFIPGAIAFAVDFYTGAIYLPPHYSHKQAGGTEDDLTMIHVDPADLTREHIEDIVRKQTGHAIHLEPGTYRATRLNGIGEFGHSVRSLTHHVPDGGASAVVFRCQSE
jgi:hypothetical protein